MEPVVAWPDRRQDVVNALEILAGPDPSTGSWPGLTEAVHWLVDDTFWDRRPPAQDIGFLLVDEGEAAAVEAAVQYLMTLADRVGPAAEDSVWLCDPAWPAVVEAARAALRVLAANASAS